MEEDTSPIYQRDHREEGVIHVTINAVHYTQIVCILQHNQNIKSRDIFE